MSGFKDHFSERSADYASYRPTYPPALVDALADRCPASGTALDVGCGTGQLSVLLAERFDEVVASDASAAQIAAATPHPRVRYVVAPAEASGLPDASVDLVVAAQAAHWFDLQAFYADARRVAKPGALIALVTYGTLDLDPPLGAPAQRFYRDVAGPYWPPERRHVEDGYRSFEFPFPDVALPKLAIVVSWDRDAFFGYVDTWSAVRGLEKAQGRAPVEAFRHEIAALWPDAAQRREVRFPLSVRAGRIG